MWSESTKTAWDGSGCPVLRNAALGLGTGRRDSERPPRRLADLHRDRPGRSVGRFLVLHVLPAEQARPVDRAALRPADPAGLISARPNGRGRRDKPPPKANRLTGEYQAVHVAVRRAAR